MLSLQGLGKTYPNGTQALSGIDLSVAPGEAVAIIGGSGSGKSTLLRLIGGLETPSSGVVAIDGKPTSGPHEAVGLIFQEPRLLPWLDIAGNVGFGLANLPPSERRRRAEDMLVRVGLGGQSRRWPKDMSGGMAQRTAIARALVTQPRFLLLDEPFSALDALTRANLQNHVVRLWLESRQTLVVVTHDIEEALVFADRVIVLRPLPGRIDSTVNVELPRPRDRDSPGFEQLKRRLRASLVRSLREISLAYDKGEPDASHPPMAEI